MSSRAWTEVAMGAEGRSFKRWARRALVPIVGRNLLLLAGMFVALVAYWELHWAVSPDPYRGDYPDWWQFENLYEPGIRPSYEIQNAVDSIIGKD